MTAPVPVSGGLRNNLGSIDDDDDEEEGEGAWSCRCIVVLCILKAWFMLLTAQHGITCQSADLESSSHFTSDAAIHRHIRF